MHGTATTLEALEGDDIGLRYHDTIVVRWNPDGSISLDSGGWTTATTKSRMNEYLPNGWMVYQERGVWYLSNRWEATWVYRDGITIHPDGAVAGAAPKEEVAEVQKKRKQVRAYATRFVQALAAGEVPSPSNGDCWYCLFHTEDGRSLGEATKDDSHLWAHIEENYYVPSLLWNALEGGNISNMAYNWLRWCQQGRPEENKFLSNWDGLFGDQVKKALVKFLYKQLGLGA